MFSEAIAHRCPECQSVVLPQRQIRRPVLLVHVERDAHPWRHAVSEAAAEGMDVVGPRRERPTRRDPVLVVEPGDADPAYQIGRAEEALR